MTRKDDTNQKAEDNKTTRGCAEQQEELVCGVIMPIGDMLDCKKEHWIDVKAIIYSSIASSGFKPQLVSDADEIGIIHERIVKNVYNNPISVCDVSHKNPNVMFELGMRLAFNKPVVIIKDDKTDYSFDTGIIEHIVYPRDLRHGKIESFKGKLSESIKKTYHNSLREDYRSFLHNFKNIDVSKLDAKEVGIFEAMKDLEASIRKDISFLRESIGRQSNTQHLTSESVNRSIPQSVIEEIVKEYEKIKKTDHLDINDLVEWATRKYSWIAPPSVLSEALLDDLLVPY